MPACTRLQTTWKNCANCESLADSFQAQAVPLLPPRPGGAPCSAPGCFKELVSTLCPQCSSSPAWGPKYAQVHCDKKYQSAAVAEATPPLPDSAWPPQPMILSVQPQPWSRLCHLVAFLPPTIQRLKVETAAAGGAGTEMLPLRWEPLEEGKGNCRSLHSSSLRCSGLR